MSATEDQTATLQRLSRASRASPKRDSIHAFTGEVSWAATYAPKCCSSCEKYALFFLFSTLHKEEGMLCYVLSSV